MNNIVGVLELSSKYRYGLTSRGVPMYLFKPYDVSWPDVVCGSSSRDISHNQIAIVTVDTDLHAHTADPAKPKPRGTLARLLGRVGDPGAERAGLLEHYCQARQPSSSHVFDDEGGCGPDFDDEDIQQPQRQEISAATGWTTFHVDPAGCRDIDDAIAWHPDSGQWAITIADVAAFVPAACYMDRIAAAVGATFYDLDGRVVRPMLPADISEDGASLLPGRRRAGISYIYDAAAPDAGHFALTWITVAYSFTYEEFATSSVAQNLDLTSVEPHDWIAQMMIRYNAAAARALVAAGTGLLRVQGQADAAAVMTWSNIHPDLATLANEAATYETVSVGADQSHASLGLSQYCHASSPLRRYADLVNQRVLKSVIAQTTLAPIPEEVATTLNERTKAQRRWTRDLVFLTHVRPGLAEEIDVIWVDNGQVWVPAWRRLLRLRHEETRSVGASGSIQIYCDPTKRNWKQRILTAPSAIDV
jgi:exoribonuclease R